MIDINVSNVMNRLEAYNFRKYHASNIPESAEPPAKDYVSFSASAKDYQLISKKLAESADVRQDKIDEVRARINSNLNPVSSAQIANKIFSSI